MMSPKPQHIISEARPGSKAEKQEKLWVPGTQAQSREGAAGSLSSTMGLTRVTKPPTG
jgi:hypothetical protein